MDGGRQGWPGLAVGARVEVWYIAKSDFREKQAGAVCGPERRHAGVC